MTAAGTSAGRAMLIVALAVIAAAAGAQQAATARGAELLAPFKRELMQALQEGLAEGPAAAIGACRDLAPGIAEVLSRDGVRLGRSSHALRNPRNVAPEWVVPILDDYARAGSDRAPRMVTLSDSRRGYVEPIITGPLCLTCHGSDLPPDVAARIEELYPEDRATGFDVGDLRGVFWVEYPAAGAL